MSPTSSKTNKREKDFTAAEITEISNIRAFTPEASVDESRPAYRPDRSGDKKKH